VRHPASARRYHASVDASVIEARLKAFFDEDSRGAVAVYLFGSVARGEARADSDVDVGVFFASDPPATLDAPQLALEAALERQLHRPVQVVALNQSSADLVHRVLRDGRLVLDRDRAARIRFEVQSRNQYFDLAPIRRRYRLYPKPGEGADANVAGPRQ
jgi:predicted nucleotidyltransferase